jgi:glycerophosphoryl diester phosphodiesterase
MSPGSWEPGPSPPARTIVIAHRAGPLDAPENSIEAIRRAAERGADAVEVDVRGTRDGVPVLLHDPWLARTTNRWLPVRLISSRSIARTRLRGSDEPLPRLSDALRVLPEGLRIAIEVKQPSIAPAVVAELRRRDAQHRALLWAESERAVRYLVGAAPEAEVALLRVATDPDSRRRMIDDALRWGARAVSVAHTEVQPDQPELVGTIRQRGLKVYSCLPDRPSEVAERVRLLDGLITDHVADGVATVGHTRGHG